MSEPISTASESLRTNEAQTARIASWQRLGILYARLALGFAFLSPVADRFGLLWGNHTSWGNFANFTRYVAQVNSFMPAFTIPFLAWAATAAETSLGILLILGISPRKVALGSATLLFLFGMAMTISFGIKKPLDYSVFSASAAALLLSFFEIRKSPLHS
jgi:putative oxidoreductase